MRTKKGQSFEKYSYPLERLRLSIRKKNADVRTADVIRLKETAVFRTRLMSPVLERCSNNAMILFLIEFRRSALGLYENNLRDRSPVTPGTTVQ